MKKILLCFLVIGVLFSSCNRSAEETSSSPQTTETESSAASSDNLKEIGGESYFLTESTENDIVSVEVPFFEGKEIVNKAVYSYILKTLKDLTAEDFDLKTTEKDIEEKEYKDYYIDISYRIALNSENLISIIFEGFLNYKTAAHPNHLFFTLNLNPKIGEKIYFSKEAKIDENLFNIFIGKATENFSEKEASIKVEQVFDKETFLTGLQREYEIESGFYCYYTEEAVGISYPVPFALGNHIEIEIPKDSVVWEKR